MAKDFVKLSEVTVLEKVSDTASVLVEQNGEIYRAPKTQVGGAGGIKTAIIRDSEYLNTIAGVSTMIGLPEYTYECLNMTFEEAYETMASGEPLNAIGMITYNGAIPVNTNGEVYFLGMGFGTECISIVFDALVNGELINFATLFWTADGLSTEMPLPGGEE